MSMYISTRQENTKKLVNTLHICRHAALFGCNAAVTAAERTNSGFESSPSAGLGQHSDL